MMERRLLQRRQQLLRQVARLEGDLAWLQGNVEVEQLEEAQERALAGLLEKLGLHERAEITAVDHALARIRRGRYGFCEGCAEPILPARQRALPTATLCHVCARAYEAHHPR
jgi:RNA polymerase-binding transcription factor DksA